MNPEVDLTVHGELLPPEEVLTGDELYYTVAEERGQLVITLTGWPELTDPTWGVIWEN